MSHKFRTRRGVLCLRLTKKLPDGSLAVADNYTMRMMRHGRRVYFPLPSDRKEAGRVADEIDAFLDVRSNTFDMAIKKFTPDRWEKVNPSAKIATVGAVLEAHEKARTALGIEDRTARGYRDSLLLLFKQGLAARRDGREPADEAVRAMGLHELNGRLVADFKVARVNLAGEDKAAQESKKRSANGVLRGVRALFSEAAREHYNHLTLPTGLDEVLAHMKFRKVGKIKKRLPAVAVLRRVFGEAHELRATDRNAYLAFLLAAHAGFRKGEIGHAQRGWIEKESTPPRLWVKTTPEFKIKDGDERFVEVQPWVIEELEALSESPANLIGGGKHERREMTFKRLNLWLKSKGLAGEKGEKAVHALRFLFGSYLTNRFNLYTAQRFLGHDSPETTNTHYADIMLDASLFALWEVRPTWAGAATVKNTQSA